MLRASRAALRPGGRLAFHTIEPGPGLSAADRRRAFKAGPPAVAVRTNHPSLLRSAGFVEIDATDVTAEYTATQRRWQEATVRHEAELREALGDENVDDGLERRRSTLAALNEGLLARTLYTGRRPS